MLTRINSSVLNIVSELEKLTIGNSYTVKTISQTSDGKQAFDADRNPILSDVSIDGFFTIIRPYSSVPDAVLGFETENGIGAGVIYKGGNSVVNGVHSMTLNNFDPERPKERTEKEYDTRFSYEHTARYSVMVFMGNYAPQDQKLTDYNGYAVLEMLDIVRMVLSGMKPCANSTPLQWTGNAPASMATSQSQARGSVWYEITFQHTMFVNDGLQLPPSYVTGIVPQFHLRPMQSLVHDLGVGNNLTVGRSNEEEILGGV